MAYIAFLDMVGTRASALIGNAEYSNAIKIFHQTLHSIGMTFNCSIFGYSDNAYIEVDTLEDTIRIFRNLRDIMLRNHRYFTASVDIGKLNAEVINIKNKEKGSIMSFTSSNAIDVYLKQNMFTGIGISLSPAIIYQLNNEGKSNDYCESIFQKKSSNLINGEFEKIYDISYNPITSLLNLRFIISDYLVTTLLNEQAGRYYITPIISMIKCLHPNIITNELKELISLITFSTLSNRIELSKLHSRYVFLFVLALIDYILSQKNTTPFCFDIKETCEEIIKTCGIEKKDLLHGLPSAPIEVISNLNKTTLIQIIYNME